jgi:hypothetical protein
MVSSGSRISVLALCVQVLFPFQHLRVVSLVRFCRVPPRVETDDRLRASVLKPLRLDVGFEFERQSFEQVRFREDLQR